MTDRRITIILMVGLSLVGFALTTVALEAALERKAEHERRTAFLDVYGPHRSTLPRTAPGGRS